MPWQDARSGPEGGVEPAGGCLRARPLACISAQAATITLGRLFVPSVGPCPAGTYLITGESVGTYPVPAPGVITSWSFQDVSTLSGLRLKVASGNGGTSYTIVADAAAGAQMTNAVNTYPEGIPVQAGEVIE